MAGAFTADGLVCADAGDDVRVFAPVRRADAELGDYHPEPFPGPQRGAISGPAIPAPFGNPGQPAVCAVLLALDEKGPAEATPFACVSGVSGGGGSAALSAAITGSAGICGSARGSSAAGISGAAVLLGSGRPRLPQNSSRPSSSAAGSRPKRPALSFFRAIARLPSEHCIPKAGALCPQLR